MIEGRDFAVAATIGARSKQEDDWGLHVSPPSLEAGALLLAVVADGMGGAPAGDQASGVAMRAFLDSYSAVQRSPQERLHHAMKHANRELGIVVEGNAELQGMGCTLVAALFFADRCEWLSVGDSFILLCRNGSLELINPLHTYGLELDGQVQRGEISVDCARRVPERDRAALTSVLDGGRVEQVAQGTLPLRRGDVLMLASDGIATLQDDEIVSICSECLSGDAARIAEALVGRIDELQRIGQDNATVVVVRSASDEGGEEATQPIRAEGETEKC